MTSAAIVQKLWNYPAGVPQLRDCGMSFHEGRLWLQMDVFHDEFVKCYFGLYGTKTNPPSVPPLSRGGSVLDRNQRKATWKEKTSPSPRSSPARGEEVGNEGRWLSYTYDELVSRDSAAVQPETGLRDVVCDSPAVAGRSRCSTKPASTSSGSKTNPLKPRTTALILM